MKPRQNLVLTGLIVGIAAQGFLVASRIPSADDTAIPAAPLVVGDTVHSLVGSTIDGVAKSLRFAKKTDAVTILYSFHPECVHCHPVAPAWTRHFSNDSTSASYVRRVAVTQASPEAAAAYARRFGWNVELLIVSSLTPSDREYFLLSRTPWVFVFDSGGVLRFHDHGSELEQVDDAVLTIASATFRSEYGANP